MTCRQARGGAAVASERFRIELAFQAGFTVAEVARRYRVGEGKVRGWIRSGALAAVNTAAMLSGKPRFVVMPEALERFERVRAAAPPPKPQRHRGGRQFTDYYPDEQGREHE
jgi:hypothetical protein